ncbi:ArsR family transcriptional regulator [Candidatus Bathyarchaeota archaeon]|nr:MAG: ArsR family transcriptional regulator [Candidatus Bathyarchaeota archaeon]
MSSQGNKRYKALDHPIRRKIVQLLADEPQTYSQLLQKLEIESGHLAYHIRNLGEMLEKDESGNYYLNREGVKAYDFLTGEYSTEASGGNSFERVVLLSLVFLMLVIAGAILLGAPDRSAELRFEEQKADTYVLSLQALDIVYEIFEDWEIPRDHWTELLLKVVKIKSNLDDLYSYSGDKTYVGFAERLEYYESELSSVIVVGDPGYMTLTVEKRYLIRELHTLLLEIEEAL